MAVFSPKSTLVRFADDAVMAFADHRDAQRVLDVLGKRLARYGLTLHPDKTRFIDFRSYRSDGKDQEKMRGIADARRSLGQFACKA
jgi:RNA-directed DNA polymerase